VYLKDVLLRVRAPELEDVVAAELGLTDAAIDAHVERSPGLGSKGCAPLLANLHEADGAEEVGIPIVERYVRSVARNEGRRVATALVEARRPG
jgi:hypothetical protein